MPCRFQMMILFMVELEWDFITVVRSDDAIGNESYEVFERVAQKYRICIDKVVLVNASSTNLDVATKGVVYLGSEGIGESIAYIK